MKKKFRVFLKDNEYLNKNSYVPRGSHHRFLAGRFLARHDGYTGKGCSPHIAVLDDENVIDKLTTEVEDFNHFFFKAILIDHPSYPTKRECGVYIYKEAKAKLTKVDNVYKLKIETLSVDGMKDIIRLEEKLWAGTLSVNKSYEEKQRKKSLTKIIDEILDKRKLTEKEKTYLGKLDKVLKKK